MSAINTWRLTMFGLITALWGLIIGGYIAIAQINGGVTSVIDHVFGDGWSAVTLIVLFAIVIGFGMWLRWLAANDHQSPTGWAIGGAVAFLLALLFGSQWVTWAWSIVWTLPLSIPLLLGAAVTVWLAESRPVHEEEDLTV